MASFIKSAQNPEDWINDGQTEFCFTGRSNVGKSSLINSLAKDNIAITSKTPGRTQLVNFFQFNNFRIIDLPGYGFANLSKTKQYDISYIMDNYLAHRSNLYGIFQIVDSGVITEMDRKMSKYFQSRFVNHYVVLNKIDKMNKNILKSKMDEIAKYLEVKVDKLIPVSAKNSTGIQEIFVKIEEMKHQIKIK
jgi:GTP-binding protein